MSHIDRFLRSLLAGPRGRRSVLARRTPFEVLSFTCALLACACVETFDGNGMRAEEPRALSGVDGVDSIASRGVLDVQVTRGDAFALRVHIDSNLLEHVATTVRGQTLVIEVEGGNLGERLPGPHVLMTLPSLRDAELTGSGSLVAEGFDDAEPVSLELVGAGKLSWSGDASEVDAVLRGQGTLTLTGSATSVDLELGGDGELDARALTAQRATIELSGTGNISATVDGRVDARVEGGDVELFGDVVRGTWEELEGGTVNGP